MKPNTLPSSDASPLAGALNSTMPDAAERDEREAPAPADR